MVGRVENEEATGADGSIDAGGEEAAGADGSIDAGGDEATRSIMM